MKQSGQENVSRAGASPSGPPPLPPDAMTTTRLLEEAASDIAALAKKELALAKAELRADVGAELATVMGLGVGAFAGLLVANALVVAAILGLGRVMAGWAAALVVAGILAVAGGIVVAVSWRRRVRSPLARTRRSLAAEIRQLKELRS